MFRLFYEYWDNLLVRLFVLIFGLICKDGFILRLCLKLMLIEYCFFMGKVEWIVKLLILEDIDNMVKEVKMFVEIDKRV